MSTTEQNKDFKKKIKNNNLKLKNNIEMVKNNNIKLTKSGFGYNFNFKLYLFIFIILGILFFIYKKYK